MSESIVPILTMALAGIMLGGAISLKNNEKKPAAAVVAVVALAVLGYGLYLLYGR
ncbi:hypothetical protein [Salininema proteolyticum]|uniref:PEP-CTERM protein-sorting domain-containing protein n=1 Tax=Salininema proteolyticum TaxID=1607685 RepID=A0ABV8TX88_9ACTN